MLNYPNTVIQVFCKAPVPGAVKTRLQPELTPEQAADIHKQLTRLTLELICGAGLCHIQLWCSPDRHHPFFSELSNDYPVALHEQSAGDLGQRMDQAITAGLQAYQQTILIGCDCPSLTRSDFNTAINALNTHDVVIAPTEDGGYSLIGLKHPMPDLFRDISWSSEKVLTQTRTKLQKARSSSFSLPTQWDIDHYSDYQRFVGLEASSLKLLRKMPLKAIGRNLRSILKFKQGTA